MHTEEQAKTTFCSDRGLPCLASECAHWRWVPLSTKEPGWADALKTLVSEGMNNAQAAHAILTPEVKKRFGLPLLPYRGFCGLSGAPDPNTLW